MISTRQVARLVAVDAITPVTGGGYPILPFGYSFFASNGLLAMSNNLYSVVRTV